MAEKTADRRTDRATGEETTLPAAECAVSLYLRSSPTAVGKRRQERVETRLAGLAEDGEIADLRVEHWPGQLRYSPEEDPPVVARYEELAAAAEAAGARLAPFFEERGGVDGLIQSYADTRVLTLPVIAVVVERDGDLAGLYPCRREGTHHRVEEAVDALAAGQAPENLR